MNAINGIVSYDQVMLRADEARMALLMLLSAYA